MAYVIIGRVSLPNHYTPLIVNHDARELPGRGRVSLPNHYTPLIVNHAVHGGPRTVGGGSRGRRGTVGDPSPLSGTGAGKGLIYILCPKSA